MDVCLVCKKDLRNFKGAFCPVCKFPNLDIFGDPEDFIRSHREEIEKHRAEFMQSVSIDVRIHRWDRSEGKLTKADDSQESFGMLSELYDRTSWLPKSFTGRSKRAELDVTLLLKKKGETVEHVITVPNPGESEHDMLGIHVDPSFNYRVLVRNQEGKTAESAVQQIFE